MAARLERSQSSHRRNYFPQEYQDALPSSRHNPRANAFVAQRLAPNRPL
jgi:hypothetical protein